MSSLSTRQLWFSAPPSELDRADLRRMAVRHACFALVPALATLYILGFTATHNDFAIDFHYAFWPAGRDVLHGISPYVATSSPLVKDGVAFVYPAPAALLFAGFGWLPHIAGDVLFTLICIAAVPGLLWVLGVRDWRLYGLALLWPAVIDGWQTANLSLPIAAGVGVAWRLRDRPLASGVIVGLLVSLKVFVWPLGVWLLASRRYRALGWALITALVLNLCAWMVLGFDQIHAYASLAGAVTKVEERAAYTPLALALHLGAGLSGARAIGFALAAVAGVACFVCGRRGREQSSLVLAIATSLLATPIVWLHYLAILIVPLAIARPRLHAVWLLPLLLLPCPATSPGLWQLLLTLSVFGLVVAELLYRPEQRPRTPPSAIRVKRAALAASNQELAAST